MSNIVELPISKCIECPYHKVVADPDPSDWFNQDDVALLCGKLPPHKYSISYSGVKYTNKMISGSLRPYQVKNIDIPNYCPLIKE